MALDKNFWNERYLTGTTGWDLGKVSDPIAAYVNQMTDKDLRILIPGCGNAYEAAYLAMKGFTDITLIDIAPELVKSISKQFEDVPAVKVVEGDFFEHQGTYDLILEQTFFCALDPSLRQQYVEHMHTLLSEKGKIAGVLFNKLFEQQGPPFGGLSEEYQQLFKSHFRIRTLQPCYNSATPRAGSEVFIILEKA